MVNSKECQFWVLKCFCLELSFELTARLPLANAGVVDQGQDNDYSFSSLGGIKSSAALERRGEASSSTTLEVSVLNLGPVMSDSFPEISLVRWSTCKV